MASSQQKRKSKTTTVQLPDLLSYFLIGSCVLIIPFLFSRRLLDPALSLRFSVLSISLFIIVFSIALFRKTVSLDLSILKRRIFPIYICYLVISAISLLSATNLSEGIFELSKIALIVIFFGASAIVLANAPNSIRRLTKAVIITSFVSAVIGICQYYGVAFNSLPGHFVVYGTMINKNFFASFLFLTLPFTLYGFFCLRNKWDMAGGLASILSLWCIILAASRAVWLAVLVGAIGVGIIRIFILRKISISKSEKKQMAVRTVILLIAFFAISSLSYLEAKGPKVKESPLRDKISSAANTGPGTSQIRLELWRKTLRMSADHPLLGVGLGNWKINIPRYGTNNLPSEQGRIHYIRPHNDFLLILAETGPLGFFSYLSLFGFSFYYLFKTLSRSKNRENNFFLLMVFFAITGFAVISSFSFPKERIAHLIFIHLLFVVTLIEYHRKFKNPEMPAVARATDAPERPGGEKKSIKHVSVPLLIISMAVLGVASVIGYYKIRSDARIMQAYYHWEKKQWEKMIEEAEKAKSPFANLDHNAAPFAWFQGIAYISLKQKERALEVLIKAVNDHPYHIQALDNLATCYELMGDHANAVKYFKRVLEISPHFENVLRNLSVIYYNMGEYNEALKTYSQADIYSRNQTLFKYLDIYKHKLEQKE